MLIAGSIFKAKCSARALRMAGLCAHLPCNIGRFWLYSLKVHLMNAMNHGFAVENKMAASKREMASGAQRRVRGMGWV